MRCAPLTPRGSCPRGRQTPVSARTPWLGGDRVPGILTHLRPRGGGQGPTPHCVRRLSLHPTFRGAFPCPGGGPLPSRKEPAVPESGRLRAPALSPLLSPLSPVAPASASGTPLRGGRPEPRSPRSHVQGPWAPSTLGRSLRLPCREGPAPWGCSPPALSPHTPSPALSPG